jgi:hypothetical protein
LKASKSSKLSAYSPKFKGCPDGRPFLLVTISGIVIPAAMQSIATYGRNPEKESRKAAHIVDSLYASLACCEAPTELQNRIRPDRHISFPA